MKNLNLLNLLFVLLIITAACDNEPDSRNVKVVVQLEDENQFELSDKSGVRVTLERGEEQYAGITGADGRFEFQQLPYGVFKVKLEKEGFITYNTAPEISNRLTDSVFTHSFHMSAVPQYTISVDSISIPDPDEHYRFYAYGKLGNLKAMPRIQYNAIAFFGDNPQVSKDNYLFHHYVAILSRKIEDNGNCEIWITNWVNNFLVPEGAEKLYVKIYPEAWYFDWITIREEAFGEPSEVYEWNLAP